MHSISKEKVLNEIKPLTIDLQEAFDSAVASAADLIDARYKSASSGFFRSMLTRVEVKRQLLDLGYTLNSVANEGIEIPYLNKFVIKVVRSNHSSNVPAPSTITRAAWYANEQMRLSPVDGATEVFWSIKNLGLAGSDIDGAVYGAIASQRDDLTHLIVDWEEDRATGAVRMAVSLPIGLWRKGQTPAVEWRSILEKDDLGNSSFVPSDENFSVFMDEIDDDKGLGVKVG